MQRWGVERTGIQRYRCLPRARTFNDLTRTAMAGTHMPEKWRAFADAMRDGLPTRRAGAQVDMNHKRALRWRRKAMAFLSRLSHRPWAGSRGRLKAWIARFRSVAAKYLHRYLTGTSSTRGCSG